jgi:nucleotide-binding universal stress UspA family protein
MIERAFMPHLRFRPSLRPSAAGCGAAAAPSPRASLSGLPQALETAVPDEAEVIRFLQPEFHGVRVTVRVELGSGWEIIPSIAEKEGCDLIVMSTHRHNSLVDAMLGSHAERIATLAPCPVIVV